MHHIYIKYTLNIYIVYKPMEYIYKVMIHKLQLCFVVIVG